MKRTIDTFKNLIGGEKVLSLQDALSQGKIADLETGEKVLLLDSGGAVYSPGLLDGWIKQGFEVSADFVNQVVQVYNHRKEILYSSSQIEVFITEADAKLRDQPLYEDEEEQSCKECGCTYYRPCQCPGGCYWVEADLCSECVKVN